MVYQVTDKLATLSWRCETVLVVTKFDPYRLAIVVVWYGSIPCHAGALPKQREGWGAGRERESHQMKASMGMADEGFVGGREDGGSFFFFFGREGEEFVG